jgi:hypothetical protein
MNFELYEVWAGDEDGHEELLETTASRTQAFELAQATNTQGYLFGIVYRETEDGELEEIKRFKHG